MLKVILIDDEEIILRGLEKIIDWEANGFMIAGAFSDSEEALAKASELQPHLVIVDIEMPGLTGLELIEALQNSLPNSKFVVLSAHDQFKYAQRALQLGVFRYLLKPIDDRELLEVLCKVRSSIYRLIEEQQQLQKYEHAIEVHQRSLKNQIIRKAVCDGLVGQVEDKSALYESLYNNFSYHLCFIQLRTPLNEKFVYDTPLKDHLDSIASHCLDRLNCCSIVFCHEDCLILVLEAPLKNIDFRLLMNELEKTVDIPVMMGLTKMFTGLADAHSHYLKLLEEFQRKIFFINSSAFFHVFSKDFPEYDDLSFLLKDANNKLTPVILQLDFDGYSNYCDSIYKNLLNLKNRITPDIVHAFYTALLNLVKRTCHIDSKENNTFIPVSVPNFKYLEDYHKYAISLVENIFIKANQLGSDGSVHIINQVKLYIHENYSKSNLKLNKIADASYINYSYLSYLFRKTTGKTFSSYLAEVRIDEAKKLLRHSSLSINEIAKRVGFQNYQNFHYAFRNICGESPNTYRARHSDLNLSDF
jgi:two-component system response regulator YesN